MTTTVAIEPHEIDLAALRFRRLWASSLPYENWKRADTCDASFDPVIEAITRKITQDADYACGSVEVGGWKVEYEYATD
jgi:hypothetical protein